MCTGSKARVRGPIASATSAGSRAQVPGSRSTNTGVAPVRTTARAVAKAEFGVVITSSPGPTPSACNARVMASIPLPTPTACGTPTKSAYSRSNASTSGPSTNHPESQHPLERRSQLPSPLRDLRREVVHGYVDRPVHAQGYSSGRQ
jgi:hypothetical protein